MMTKVIAERPATNQEENRYHPNKVENQWVSIDITQSQAPTEEETAKNTKKIADHFLMVYQWELPPCKSSCLDRSPSFLKKKIQNPKNTTNLKIKKSGKLPFSKGQKK